MRDGVTIGIPLFNEDEHIEAAVRSAAGQCDVLLVSDNASTDRSAEICQRLAREFKHLIFFRQPTNLGASANFKFLLDNATTSKFMWLGGHDLVPQGYVAALDQALATDASVVLAYGPTEHIDTEGNSRSRYEYTYSDALQAREPFVRLLALIRFLSNCSLIHGLFRTNSLRTAWVEEMFIGVDHALLARAALLGKFAYVPTTFLRRRDVHLEDSKAAQLERLVGHSGHGHANYMEMQRQQFALVCKATQGTGITGSINRVRARYFLVKRFGPFSNKALARGVDGFLQILFEFYRRTLSRLL